MQKGDVRKKIYCWEDAFITMINMRRIRENAVSQMVERRKKKKRKVKSDVHEGRGRSCGNSRLCLSFSVCVWDRSIRRSERLPRCDPRRGMILIPFAVAAASTLCQQQHLIMTFVLIIIEHSLLAYGCLSCINSAPPVN